MFRKFHQFHHTDGGYGASGTSYPQAVEEGVSAAVHINQKPNGVTEVLSSNIWYITPTFYIANGSDAGGSQMEHLRAGGGRYGPTSRTRVH